MIRHLTIGWLLFTAACAAAPVRQVAPATGDLGVIIERGAGAVLIVDVSQHKTLARVTGLGDLSHASAVFSRDMRYAYVFGRDGGLTKVDLLTAAVAKRIVQSGNSIGGAISQDGRFIATSNYTPGGVKIFDAETLALVADLPATGAAAGTPNKSVGIVDLPGNRFASAFFESGEVWLVSRKAGGGWEKRVYADAGKNPYDAGISPEGRFYVVGLFGEDGLALLDTWNPDAGLRKILPDYGQGEAKLPVYKMPHLEGWGAAGRYSYVPGVGRHEVLVIDREDWRLVERIPVLGQPIFCVASPDGRSVWVNFALPDNAKVQVIDTQTRKIARTLEPGKAVLHIEFTPKGDEAWLSARDDDRVVVYGADSGEKAAELAADKPSGIFFTARAHRIGM